MTSVSASVKPDELPRRLGVASTAILLVGITIGSGIFRVPSTAASQIGSVGGVALVWLAGAAISLAGALPLVVSALPRTGGAYVYIREGFGPLAAFLYGWIKLIVTGPAALAAIALIFDEYMRAFAPLSDLQVQLVAGALLVVLTVANVRSVNWSARLQNASTVTKVLALAALSLMIFGRGDAAHGAFAQPIAWSGVTTSGFWTALIAVLWTYTGWVDVTYVAGEIRDPARTFPRAMLSGMTIVVVLYLVINAAYLYVLPMPAMASSTLVAATASERTIGTAGAGLVALLVMVSTFGSLNGSILTSPRVFFALADDGLFFRSVAAVHPRYQTLYVALVLYMVLGLAGVATRTFEQLAELFVIGVWPFYALSVAAVFLVPRRRPELAAQCRGWGHPVLPIAFLVVSAAMLANGVVARPFETALSTGIILLGIPVYFVWRALRNRRTLVPPTATATAGSADR
ncbi:MAG TPA: amino acid permease [Gemmatimonadaceae bacterium]